jgi:hypothetical protein
LTNRWEVMLLHFFFLSLLAASKPLGTTDSMSKGVDLGTEGQVMESITTLSQIRSICSPVIIVFKFGGKISNRPCKHRNNRVLFFFFFFFFFFFG